MGEGWSYATGFEAFEAAAGAFLRSSPVEHTVLLSVAAMIGRRGGDVWDPPGALLAWWRDAEGDVAGAAVNTPPWPVLMSAPTGAAEALGRELRAAGRPVAMVNADEAAARGFADGYGAEPMVHQRHRLHRLAGLRPPEPAPPGLARLAGAADRDLLVAWMRAFAAEAGEPHDDAEAIVDERLVHGGFLLWEGPDGTAVATAAANPPAEGVVRIGPVYTPPEHRRRGYGAAVTAALTAASLADGAREVLLFTDEANPTSNALYRRLGFEPLGVRVLLALR